MKKIIMCFFTLGLMGFPLFTFADKTVRSTKDTTKVSKNFDKTSLDKDKLDSPSSDATLKYIFRKFLSCKDNIEIYEIEKLAEAAKCFNKFFHPDISNSDKAQIEQWLFQTKIDNVHSCTRAENRRADLFHSSTPQRICFSASNTNSEPKAYVVFFKDFSRDSRVWTIFKTSPFLL
jgi:hypothetical protein